MHCIPLFQPLLVPLPCPLPSAQTSASFHPPSSAAPPETPDALPHTSAANCNTHNSAVSHMPVHFLILWMYAWVCDVIPDRFALWVCVFETKLFKLAASVKLVMPSVGLLSQVFHIYAYEHLPQLNKVAVILIFHWHTHIKEIKGLFFIIKYILNFKLKKKKNSFK